MKNVFRSYFGQSKLNCDKSRQSLRVLGKYGKRLIYFQGNFRKFAYRIMEVRLKLFLVLRNISENVFSCFIKYFRNCSEIMCSCRILVKSDLKLKI